MATCIAILVVVACGDGQVRPSPRPADEPNASPLAATAAERSCHLEGQAMANAYGPGAALVATFSVSAPQMAAWQERWPGPGPSGPHIAVGSSRYRSHPTDEVLALCWFDGSFVNFGHGPGPAGPGCPAAPPTASCVAATESPLPVPTRLVVVVEASGPALLLAIGPREGLPVSDPRTP